jgi:hypothetical protein
VIEQLGLVMKWTGYVLCSKESTVGLQELLSLFADLFDFLRENKYELSDSEALLLVPILFDKASVAKVRSMKHPKSHYIVLSDLLLSCLQGRFKDTFMDLVVQVNSDDLLPPKRMGPLVCVSVIEGSHHPKARLMACKQCRECVEKIGLSGIGKKGVLVAAKALSEEKLQENRTALLDLVELLLAKMNGDMQRFTRICGSSLSEKARSLLEERVKKGGKDGVSHSSRSGIPAGPSASESGRRASRLLNQTKATPSKQTDLGARSTPKPPPAKYNSDNDSVSSSAFRDELPALDLRAGLRDTPSGHSGIPRPSVSSSIRPTSQLHTDPIPSTLLSPTEADLEESAGLALDDSYSHGADETAERLSAKANLFATSSAFQPSAPTTTECSGPSASDSLGAAASLRARLMKLRDRNNNTVADIPYEENKGVQATKPQLVDEKERPGQADFRQPQSQPAAVDRPMAEESQPQSTDSTGEEDMKPKTVPQGLQPVIPATLASTPLDDLLDKYLDSVRFLLAKIPPLEEEDADIIGSTDVLKTIHAAVSQQAHLAVDLDTEGVNRLREEIKIKTNDVVATLTR